MKRKIYMALLLSIGYSLPIQAQTYNTHQAESYTDETLDQADNNADNSEWNWYETDPAAARLLQSSINDDAPASNMLFKLPIGSDGAALGGIPDPLPDTPIDSTIYVLLIGVLLYGYVTFRKEKKLRW